MPNKDISKGFSALLGRLETSEGYDLDALKVELCEQIYLIMEQENVTKAELARRLQTSRAYITKLLQGSANLTLDSLVKVARALDCKVSVELRSKAKGEVGTIWEAKKVTSLRLDSFKHWRREEFGFAGFGVSVGGAKAHRKDAAEIISTARTSATLIKFVAKAA